MSTTHTTYVFPFYGTELRLTLPNDVPAPCVSFSWYEDGCSPYVHSEDRTVSVGDDYAGIADLTRPSVEEAFAALVANSQVMGWAYTRKARAVRAG